MTGQVLTVIYVSMTIISTSLYFYLESANTYIPGEYVSDDLSSKLYYVIILIITLILSTGFYYLNLFVNKLIQTGIFSKIYNTIFIVTSLSFVQAYAIFNLKLNHPYSMWNEYLWKSEHYYELKQYGKSLEFAKLAVRIAESTNKRRIIKFTDNFFDKINKKKILD